MKEELIHEATGGRTTHSSEMTDAEAQALIGKLTVAQVREVDYRDKLRKRLIAMSYSIQESQTFVKDWCEKYGVFEVKRKFNEYSEHELRGLIEKFKKVVAHRKEKASKL